MRAALAILAAILAPLALGAAELPIFDAHIHYSHDAWDRLPPADAVALLRKAGVTHALVSSSNDDGQEKLYAEAPDLIIPSLRPYRTRSDVSGWVRDEGIVGYVEQRLQRALEAKGGSAPPYRYFAIGEFHVYGADADLPVVRRMVQLAKQHRLLLHAHSDADAIERLFRQDPDARILWAHSGFERPERVRELLRAHRNLWCDLAFRTDHASGGKVDPDWRAAFTEFPDRFMLGTDTYVPERWYYVTENASASRQWLADLPPALAERIAYRNGEALFGAAIARTQQ
ncbi:MAG TPA: amidohydrolase family protein [Burkholderiales bacterium]|nr:amidohydrolase family protein [Burkholderiales bacterium]